MAAWDVNQLRLACAVGPSVAGTKGAVASQAPLLYLLGDGLDSNAKTAMQTKASSDGSLVFGDVAGFSTGTSDKPGVWLEPPPPSFQRLQKGTWADGRAVRIDATTGRKIGYFVDPSSGFLHPYSQKGDPLVLATYTDLNPGIAYVSGQAQAITGGLIAGWVDSGDGQQQICYWTQDILTGGFAGPYVPDSSLHGNATHVFGDPSTFVYIQGYDSDANRLFQEKVNVLTGAGTIVHLGRAGELGDPPQGTDDSFVGEVPNVHKPALFVFTQGDDRFGNGAGCADDIRAVMTPHVLPSDVVNTKVSGVATASNNPGNWSMGGTDLATGKLWTAPITNFHYQVSGPAPGSWFTPIHALFSSGIRFTDAAYVDGLFVSLFKGRGGATGELCSAQVETSLPAVLDGASWFRVTSRVHTGVYLMNIKIWNYNTGSWDDKGDVQLQPYMLTYDVSLGDGEISGSLSDYRVKALLKVYNGFGSTAPAWEIEQARAITWDGTEG